MNRRRERLLVSLLCGLCLALSSVRSLDDLTARPVEIVCETLFVVFFVYALELAIANGFEAGSGAK